MSMKRKLTATFVVVMTFAAFVTFGTLALFTGSQDVGANSFTTGNVDITASPSSALVTFSSMAPGDEVTNPLVVTNSGTLAMRYSISASATNADTKGLKDQLVLEIRTVDVDATVPCDDFDGTVLYSGDLDSSTGLLVGDPASGSDTGDRVLTAAANETLCFRVSLPLGTSNSFEDATTTVTFTFDAEQTVNNP